MSSSRDILYRNYSASFESQKALNAGIQHAQYEATYEHLPSDRRCSVADLGCGKGEWIAWMASKGFTHLTGIDLSPSDLAIARQNDPARKWVEGNVITFLESQTGAFDLLHAKDIIEHFTKDEFMRFLSAAKSALKPGGRLWMLTFNAQSPMSSVTRYGDFTHETGHTPSSLAQCLRASGFKEVRVSGLHYCSSSLGGRMRALFGAVVYGCCRVLIALRHGKGSPSPGIDRMTASPDLFIEAAEV
ncbi:MAG: hypothetical protein B7Z47_00470 [Chthoniobacter sp. 12-60-6]|nr:MAG: hypothetical protein B7Z47_00470 [Chthoniobacter sp. 12-60-6]